MRMNVFMVLDKVKPDIENIRGLTIARHRPFLAIRSRNWAELLYLVCKQAI
jgi:hypothetical protein